MDALGSHMQNKYSEDTLARRYYGGNEFIDQAELLCQNELSKYLASMPRNGE
jgi:glycine hydroxymethyltransferase